MVCRQVPESPGGRRPAAAQGGRRRRRAVGDRRDVLEQYRKLRLVLPNISGRGKISKVGCWEQARQY
jgi:hypothetical protein